MIIKKGYIYYDGESYYCSAVTGDFSIADMWECDKNGIISDIIDNPYPLPIYTNDLKLIKKNDNKSKI